jgi:cell division inhibitor SepF
MGSWRRVGAFLGLVPDDSNPYDNESYDSAGYVGAEYDGSGYESAGHDEDQAGRSARSGGSSARNDGPGGYAESGYPDRKADPYAADGYRAGAAGSTPQSSRAPRRSFGTEPVTQGALAMKADQRRDDTSTASRPASVKLTGFGEARIVGEKYRDGQSVILDMTGMSDSDARRLVDFSAGLAFSLRGSIEKVAPKVFMLLPAEADIAGGAASALENARAYVGSSVGR